MQPSENGFSGRNCDFCYLVPGLNETKDGFVQAFFSIDEIGVAR